MAEQVPSDEGASTVGGGQVPTFAPLYRQIRALILRSLKDGEWKPGDMIPSETELAVRFGVSQGTARRAIDELAAENVLVRRQGRGTFVASHLQRVNQFRFLKLRPDDGDLEPLVGKVLECRRTRPTAAMARQLRLRPGEAVILTRRVLRFGDRGTVLDEIWLPAERFKGFSAEGFESYQGLLYGYLEAEFGVQMLRAEERLKAVLAQSEQAEGLGVEVGTPLLQVDRVSFTYEEQPVEVRRGYYVTASHHYFNHLG